MFFVSQPCHNSAQKTRKAKNKKLKYNNGRDRNVKKKQFVKPMS